MSAGDIKSIILRVEELIEENKCLGKKEEILIKKKENVKRVEELIKENKSFEEKEEILTKKRQENVTEICNLLNESKRVSSGATSPTDANGSIVIEEVKGDGEYLLSITYWMKKNPRQADSMSLARETWMSLY